MEFRKKFKLSLEDYTSFNMFFLRKQLVVPPIIFLLIVLLIMSVFNFDLITVIAFLIISVLMFGILFLFNLLYIKRLAKKQYLSSRSMQLENELVLDDSGIRENGECGTTIAMWTDVLYAVESNKAFHIHFSRMQAFVIPKRIIDKKEDADIRTLLKNNLPEKKYRLKA